MKTTFQVRTIIHESGERSPVFIDRSTGIPNLRVNEWKLFSRRAATNSSLTLEKQLREINVFYIWADGERIDLEERFATGVGLSNQELSKLKEFCYTNFKVFGAGSVGVERCTANQSVTASQRLQRINTIRQYCNWQLDKAITEALSDGKSDAKINVLIYTIERHEKQLRVKASDQPPRAGLSDALLQRLFEIIDPNSSHNPFKSGSRFRNFLIILVLYFFGLRKSECLLLTIADVDYRVARPVMVVRRVPDSRLHNRKDVAVKTLERTIPITDDVARLIRQYIRVHRSAIPRASRSPFLFLGRHGDPLGTDGIDSIFRVICRSFPEFKSLLSPHTLRHNWSGNMWERTNDLVGRGAMQEELAKLVINYLGGWTHQSNMSRRYSNNLIESKANEIHLHLMRDLEVAIGHSKATATVTFKARR